MPNFGQESIPFGYRPVLALVAAILLAMTALAAYACSTIVQFSLPVSPVLSAFAILVPLLNLPFLAKIFPYLSAHRNPNTLTLTQKQQQSISRNPRLTLSTTLLLILDAVLITLASTHIPSSSLSCNLGQRWAQLFQSHDARAIRTIQDALECCGFNTPKDRAYPFPAKHVGPDACMNTYGRDKACGGAWMGKEKQATGIMVAVGGVLAIFKILAVLWAYYQEVRAERRWFMTQHVDPEERPAEDARRRIEEVPEEVHADSNGDHPTDRSMLLPAAVRGTPWGEEGTAEHEDTLI